MNWIAKTFAWGRFKDVKVSDKDNYGYFIAQFFVAIITEFRSFLALILVLIFAIALIRAMVITGNNVKDFSDALQSVMATLGGLVGSIVGYYFGESASKKTASSTDGGNANTPAIQKDNGNEPPVNPVQTPSEIVNNS